VRLKKKKKQNQNQKPTKHAEETQNETKTDHKFSDTVHKLPAGCYRAVLVWLEPHSPCASQLSRIPGRIRAAWLRKTTGSRRPRQRCCLEPGGYRRTLCRALLASCYFLLGTQRSSVQLQVPDRVRRQRDNFWEGSEQQDRDNQSSSKTKAIHFLTNYI